MHSDRCIALLRYSRCWNDQVELRYLPIYARRGRECRTYGPSPHFEKNVRGDTRFVRYEASQDGSHPTQGRHG
jgi:hypothetical protein